MSSLKRWYQLRKQAEKARVEPVRAAQIERSSITVNEDARDMVDVVSEVTETVETVSDQQLDLDTLEPVYDAMDMAQEVDDDAHAARMLAIEASGQVGDALDAADQALEKAANAEQTALGNVRVYSETEPEAPEEGWAVGAEWIVEVGGKPREVRVWNGTEFVHSQWLINELLIPGEEGAIQIGDGVGIFPRVVGGVFEAGTYYGGDFIQYASDDMVAIYPETDGVVETTDWEGGAPDSWGAAAASTGVKETGTHSVYASRTGAGSLSMLWTNHDRTPLLSVQPRGVAVRVRATAALTGVHVTTPDGTTAFDDLPANTWVWLVVDLADSVSLEWAHVGGVTAGSATLYVDQIRVVATALNGAHMRITRNSRGVPGVFAVNGDGDILGSFTPDGVRSFEPGGEKWARLANGALSVGDDVETVVYDADGIHNPVGVHVIDSPDGLASTRELKVLATHATGQYLNTSHTINLAEPISEQLNGVVIAWSRYTSGAADNSWWNFQFIPKSKLYFSGVVATILTGASNDAVIAKKVMSVSDTAITGASDNNGSLSPNDRFVWRHVYGY